MACRVSKVLIVPEVAGNDEADQVRTRAITPVRGCGAPLRESGLLGSHLMFTEGGMLCKNVFMVIVNEWEM
jgi:hypothetical protein